MLIKTMEQIKREVNGLLDNHWRDIVESYNKSAGTTVTIKIGIEPEGQKVLITPVVSFYPEPKYVSEKYSVRVNEYQMELFTDGKEEPQ